MAGKKPTGGAMGDVTVEILRDIRGELRTLNVRVGRVEGELGRLEKGLTELRATTADGFEQLTSRMENLREFSGDRWRDHERRIQRLERAARR